jgi:hypothetical protein
METDLTPQQKKEVLNIQDPPQSEPIFRFNTKESAKGFRYYEWTVRGDSIEELQKRNDEVRDYISKLRREDIENSKGNLQD